MIIIQSDGLFHKNKYLIVFENFGNTSFVHDQRNKVVYLEVWMFAWEGTIASPLMSECHFFHNRVTHIEKCLIFHWIQERKLKQGKDIRMIILIIITGKVYLFCRKITVSISQSFFLFLLIISFQYQQFMKSEISDTNYYS